MSMITYIQGLKPKTEEYEKKLQIYRMCKEMNVSIPEEIEEFFNGEVCERGIITEIPKDAVENYGENTSDIFELDLSKIPSDVTKIRFVNSY